MHAINHPKYLGGYGLYKHTMAHVHIIFHGCVYNFSSTHLVVNSFSIFHLQYLLLMHCIQLNP